MRSLILKLLMLALGTVTAALVTEGAIRFGALEKEVFWQPHEHFGWTHIPGREGLWFSDEFRVHVTINSKGLRNRETPYDKPAGTKRILVLGDSMTEGLQVPGEATFSSRLESRLNGPGRPPVEVINGGVSHYGTSNELLFYRHEGSRYQPDVVILAFLTTNDVMNNSHELGGQSPYFTLADGDGLDLKDFPLPAASQWTKQVRASLGQQLHSYRFVSRTVRENSPGLVKLLQATRVFARDPGGSSSGSIPTDFFVYATEYDRQWSDAWEITRRLIVTLKREVESHGARFMVAVFSPQFVRVRPDNWEDWVRANPAMKAVSWDLEKPDRLIAELLSREAIPYVQTLDRFDESARASGKRYYFPSDGHFDADGHELAAELIEQRLANLGYLGH
jgi:lysophospholipase L1-like esterase